jgi:hypothetical protein
MVIRSNRATGAVAIGVAGVFLLLSACSSKSEEPQPGTPTTHATVPVSTAPVSTTSTPPQRQPHILVFTATGTATLDSVTYVVDGHTVTNRSAKLPWRVSLSLPADGAMHNYDVSVLSHHGSVNILAILDGSVTGNSSGSSSGTGTAQLNGSIAG